jgi:hypothetical protein
MHARFKAATTQAEKDRIAQNIIKRGGRPPRGYGQGLTGNTTPGQGLTGGYQPAPAPDWGNYKLDTAKGVLNAETAGQQWSQGENIRLNRPNEFNPYGSMQYTTDPVTGQTIATSSLSPEMQSRLNQEQLREMNQHRLQQEMFGGLRDQLGRPLDFSGLPEINKDYSQDRQRVEDSIYSRFQRRFKDQFAEEKNNLQQQLADRGIPMGSERYNKEMQQLSQRQNDATLNAQAQAVEMGGQEQQNLFNMGLTGRQQGLNERLTQRSVPLSEYGAIQGLQQGVVNPNFSPMYQNSMQAPNVLGAANMQQQGQLTREQMANQLQQSRISAGTAGVAAGISANTQMALANQQRQWDLEDQAKMQAQLNANKPNPWMPALTGIAQGAGSAIVGGLLG